ncbi:VPLPA-CTERM sorting domain-containing protein [Labrenzia sp. DG1229]|uniref:VPLPA-CTERM sorting domain-containing protein n=1 Tax=Labrenzia sp. DG1229 TaxID=681847 RepID=UPI00048AD2F8|nr:VPLPA-CTERM sorting domain-containing protein [Labrenzia sp. DG1229]
MFRGISTFIAAMGVFGGAALADTISPLSYTNNTLGVGDTVTISKTVVIESTGPTDALLDVMFLVDTTGSMGRAIANAKSAASNIITGLGGFGDVQTGAGFYNDPAFNGVLSDLTSTAATTIATINTFTASGGGDFPERGHEAIKDAADNASWRPGSNRFIVVLGDASFKDSPVSPGAVTASLAAEGIELIGLEFGAGAFGTDIAALGGDVFAGGSSPSDIVDAILDGVSAGFDEYTKVTVDDLGAGLPEIGVSVVCTGADTGACVGDTAEGMYDRSVDRTFTFDVTFERLAAGDSSFGTHALVDGGIVATEKDSFGDTAVVPLPAAGFLMIFGLGSLAVMSRRRKSA